MNVLKLPLEGYGNKNGLCIKRQGESLSHKQNPKKGNSKDNRQECYQGLEAGVYAASDRGREQLGASAQDGQIVLKVLGSLLAPEAPAGLLETGNNGHPHRVLPHGFNSPQSVICTTGDAELLGGPRTREGGGGGGPR